jgi:hypothetical protein
MWDREILVRVSSPTHSFDDIVIHICHREYRSKGIFQCNSDDEDPTMFKLGSYRSRNEHITREELPKNGLKVSTRDGGEEIINVI